MKRSAEVASKDQEMPVKRQRGRPSTGAAMSNAERQRRYRQNRKLKSLSVTENIEKTGQGGRAPEPVDYGELLERSRRVNQSLLNAVKDAQDAYADLLNRYIELVEEKSRLELQIASN